MKAMGHQIGLSIGARRRATDGGSTRGGGLDV
jgi:hypothetical protein